MTTSCDSDRSFATNSHRKTSEALKSTLATGIRPVVLMAGIYTACDCGRTLRGEGKRCAGRRGRRKGEESDPQRRTRSKNTHSLSHFV